LAADLQPPTLVRRSAATDRVLKATWFHVEIPNRRASIARRESSLQRRGLSRELLVERLKLERDMLSMCPRFFLFVCVSLLLCMTFAGNDPQQRGTINGLLVSSLGLDDVTNTRMTMESALDFMRHFAEASSSWIPVNEQYVAQPENLKITTGMKRYANERALPEELRPRMRSSFTLTAWVASSKETYLVRAQPRTIELRSPLEVCWGWRYPATLIYGFHDIAIDQPARRVNPIMAVATPRPAALDQITMEALSVNGTHASFYRDATLLSIIRLPRPVTDCSDASLIVGDATSARIGQYAPRPAPFVPRAPYVPAHSSTVCTCVAPPAGSPTPRARSTASS
jgi:hypothetical protein